MLLVCYYLGALSTLGWVSKQRGISILRDSRIHLEVSPGVFQPAGGACAFLPSLVQLWPSAGVGCWHFPFLLFFFYFFPFHFRTSIWLACSQGCHSADKPSSLSSTFPNPELFTFSEHCLHFIHRQPFIYMTTSIKLFFFPLDFQRTFCQSEVKYKQQQPPWAEQWDGQGEIF